MKNVIRAKKLTSDCSDVATGNLSLNRYGEDFELRLCEPIEQKTISSYERGMVKVALFSIQGVGYFMSKFGNENWTTTSFHASLTPSGHKGVSTQLAESKGSFNLQVLVCDEKGHQEFGSRIITLGSQVTLELAKTALYQLKNPISKRTFETRVRSARAHQNLSQMAESTAMVCVAA